MSQGVARIDRLGRRSALTWGKPLITTVIAFSLSGCGAYLHNPDRATVTADLKAKADKMTAPAYFEAQENNLASLAQREDQALAELLTASRDYRLLNAIRPTTSSTKGTDEESSEARLRALIAADLSTTYGTGFLSPTQLKKLKTSPYVTADATSGIGFQRQRVATTVGDYRSSGGTHPTDCRSVILNPDAQHTVEAQQARYERLLQACRNLARDEERLNDCKLGATAGDLRTACDAVAALQDDPAASAQRVQLVDAEKALRAAMKAANPSQEVQAAKDADAFLASVQALPEDEEIQKILVRVQDIFGKQLGNSIDAMNSEVDAISNKVSEPLSAALAAIGAAYQFRDAARVNPAETSSAMLIGIAKLRHDINVLDIAIAARRQEREIVRQQAEALRQQLFFLARAQDALCNDGPKGCVPVSGTEQKAEALNYYARSQTVGRGPYEILTFRRLQLRRATALKEAKATEADYRALIQPAIDQLAAYGAGGIKPEQIADFLSSLPVTGAILAE